MKITLIGTGTSHGIPVIGCGCEVCRSSDEKDKRLRCGAFVQDGETAFVIDAGPEFRIQALKFAINRLDAVFITHSHADHCHGLDDLRIYSVKKDEEDKSSPKKLAVYCNAQTKRDLEARFAYVFKQDGPGGGIPNIELIDAEQFTRENPLKIGSVEIIPIPLTHGKISDSGWLMRSVGKDGKRHSAAYLTDCNFISRDSLCLIRKFALTGESNAAQTCAAQTDAALDYLVIDGLRRKKHSTHCNFDEALFYADIIAAKHTRIIHISHDISHALIADYLNERINGTKPRHETTDFSRLIQPANPEQPSARADKTNASADMTSATRKQPSATRDETSANTDMTNANTDKTQGGSCDYPNLKLIIERGGSVLPAYDGEVLLCE